MTPATRIRLCRRLEVEWEGERLEAALPGNQGRLLFAYLVLHRERTVRRDELLEVLWSGESAPQSADAVLSAPLSRLRKALGSGRLNGRGELSLALPPATWVDWEAAFIGVREAHAAVAAERWPDAWIAASAALEIADGGLLPGLEARWIDEKRSQLEDLRIELLEVIATSGARIGGAQLRTPSRPPARRSRRRRSASPRAPALIDVLRARGNVADALRAFEDARTLLREELGATPGPLLQSLHQQLLHAEPPTVVSRPPLPDRLAAALETPLVGRREPLARLQAELRRAREGESPIVLVTGEGGIGKTRLIAEVANGAGDFAVLYGRCDEDQLFPFGPWIEMLGGALARVADAELPALLGAEGPELARLLPELRGRVPGLAAPGPSDPDSELRHLYTAVVALVRRLARRRPLLAIIDDLHWADRSSLLLGRHLVRTSGARPRAAARRLPRHRARRGSPAAADPRRPRARPAAPAHPAARARCLRGGRAHRRGAGRRPRAARGDARQPVLRRAARPPPRRVRDGRERRAARRDRAPGRAAPGRRWPRAARGRVDRPRFRPGPARAGRRRA